MQERTIEAARAREPMTADNVRWTIAQMEAAKSPASTRKRFAELAIKTGNISPEGKAVWREYASTL